MALTFAPKKVAASAAALLTLGTGIMAAPGADAAPGGTYNIRTGPGLSYPVIGQMHNPNCRNLFYAISAGPRHVDGYVWNQVRSDSGVIGWAINDDWCI